MFAPAALFVSNITRPFCTQFVLTSSYGPLCVYPLLTAPPRPPTTDLDGNELLDQNEGMALFKTELDKIYNGTDYDPREREEEMNEMRESTYAEVDTDRDGFIR